MVCVPVYGQKMWAESTGWDSNSRLALSGQTVGSNVVSTCHLVDVRYAIIGNTEILKKLKSVPTAAVMSGL